MKWEPRRQSYGIGRTPMGSWVQGLAPVVTESRDMWDRVPKNLLIFFVFSYSCKMELACKPTLLAKGVSTTCSQSIDKIPSGGLIRLMRGAHTFTESIPGIFQVWELNFIVFFYLVPDLALSSNEFVLTSQPWMRLWRRSRTMTRSLPWIAVLWLVGRESFLGPGWTEST